VPQERPRATKKWPKAIKKWPRATKKWPRAGQERQKAANIASIFCYIESGFKTYSFNKLNQKDTHQTF